MAKQPLFDVGRFNTIADRYGICWYDRIVLIDTICWGDGFIGDCEYRTEENTLKRFLRAIERERRNPKPVVRGSKVGIKARSTTHVACAACG